MASSDSRSNRSLWSACGINIRRRLFLCSPEVVHCMRFELRYCTHTTLSVQSRGRSLHWGLSWGIAHTTLSVQSRGRSLHGVWVEVLHTHTTLFVQSRGRSLHWGLSWSIAHTQLFLCSSEVICGFGSSCYTQEKPCCIVFTCAQYSTHPAHLLELHSKKKKNMGSLNYVCTCLWDEHGLIPRPRFHSLGTGEDSGGLLVT